MPTSYVLTGFNQVGKEPETEPKRFSTVEEALRDLRDELMWCSEDFEYDTGTRDAYFDAATEVAKIYAILPHQKRLVWTVSGWEYWVLLVQPTVAPTNGWGVSQI
jgi:hypothetical protein